MEQPGNKGHTRRSLLRMAGGLGGITAFANSAAGETETQVRSVTQQSDGTLVVGVDSVPDSLNVLMNPEDPLGIFDSLYDPGIIFDPTSQEIRPWLINDWYIKSKANPYKVLVTFREGLTWHDGKPVTNEDLAFTARYLRENSDIARKFHPFANISDVDTPADGQVRYVFDKPIGGWQVKLLGAYILPKHVWEGRNPETDEPNTGNGPVGSGPFVVDEFSDSVLRLRPRSQNYAHPPARRHNFVRNSPNIPALEFREVPVTSKQAVSRLVNEDITALSSRDYPRLENQRQRAAKHDGIRVQRSDSFALRRVAFNLRRKPLNDIAMREAFARSWSETFFLQKVRRQEATDGDLVAPPNATHLRPFDTDSAKSDRYEFIGENGTIDIGKFRSFLGEHPSASASYQSRDAETLPASQLPNGEIHINGVPFGEAKGGGNGPLRVLTANPPQSVRQALEEWTHQLRRAGIPIVLEVVGKSQFDSQVHVSHDFDLAEQLWRINDPLLSHLSVHYGKPGIDSDDYSYNPMGYTNSQYLRKARNQNTLSARNDYITRALEEIYNDLPVFVYAYPAVFEPVRENWDGWIHARGGITNQFSWLNVRQTGPYTGGTQSSSESSTTTSARATTPASTSQSTPSHSGASNDNSVQGHNQAQARGFGQLGQYAMYGAGGIAALTGIYAIGWMFDRAGKSISGATEDIDTAADDESASTETTDAPAGETTDADSEIGEVESTSRQPSRHSAATSAAVSADVDREDTDTSTEVSDETGTDEDSAETVTDEPAETEQEAEHSEAAETEHDEDADAETEELQQEPDQQGGDTEEAEQESETGSDSDITLSTGATPLSGEEFAEATAGITTATRRTHDGYVTTYHGTLDTGDDVQIRVLDHEFEDEDAVATAMTRIREWNNITSQGNILSVLDWGESPSPWVATERTSERDVRDLRDEHTDAELVEIVGKISDAVRHAALYNTYHFDLRPECVHLVPKDERNLPAVRVGDWGIADAARMGAGLDYDPYYAPEQIDPDEFGTPGAQTSVYRTGAIAYTLLTGDSPFDEQDDLGEVICEGDITPPSEQNTALPAAVDEPILKAMNRNPTERYTSTHHFHLELQDAI